MSVEKRNIPEGSVYWARCRAGGFCPGVPVHKGITIVVSLFMSHWLAVVYCLVFCIGSCEPTTTTSFICMAVKELQHCKSI